MPETKKVFLPKQKVGAGMRHGYQGDNVVVVDSKGKQVGKGEARPKPVSPADAED